MRNKWHNVIAFTCGGITAIFFIAATAGFFMVDMLSKPFLQTAGLFKIYKGQTLKEVAFSLEKEGIISRPLLLIWYGEITGRDKAIRSGVYDIPPLVNAKGLLGLFENGSNVRTKVLLPEGITMKGGIERLRAAGLIIDENTFLRVTPELKSAYSFLRDAPEGVSLEGFIFPDTYTFDPMESPGRITRIILDNFNRKFKPEWYEAAGNDGRSVYEVITMASILEKEVRTIEEKKIASGILWKRLALGMPLQVDSSVNYVTGKSLPAVTYQDITADSLYNTYKYSGLPPGPIANPGEESLEAAVYPQNSLYWFYLSRQDTGETIFSETYRQHTRAKARYLRS